MVSWSQLIKILQKSSNRLWTIAISSPLPAPLHKTKKYYSNYIEHFIPEHFTNYIHSTTEKHLSWGWSNIRQFMYTTQNDRRDGKIKDWYAEVSLHISSKSSNAFMGKHFSSFLFFFFNNNNKVFFFLKKFLWLHFQFLFLCFAFSFHIIQQFPVFKSGSNTRVEFWIQFQNKAIICLLASSL